MKYNLIPEYINFSNNEHSLHSCSCSCPWKYFLVSWHYFNSRMKIRRSMPITKSKNFSLTLTLTLTLLLLNVWVHLAQNNYWLCTTRRCHSGVNSLPLPPYQYTTHRDVVTPGIECTRCEVSITFYQITELWIHYDEFVHVFNY